MTKKELSQYYWLQKEINGYEEKLKELRSRAMSVQAPALSDMPKGGGLKSRIEEYVAEILDLEAIIMAKQLQCIHERQRLERFILSIPDSMTRLIFDLRCVQGKTWKEVAACMGGGMTENTACQIFLRYTRRARKAENS